MASLRDQLKEASPELHHALLKSWDIAVNQWLPAISPSQDSYNSRPHLRNIEKYLEDIIQEVNSDLSHDFFLNPCEIYIILSAILFHDIGRVLKRGQTKKNQAEYNNIKLPDGPKIKPKNHAEASSLMIRKDWGRFGIYSEELADIIHRICYFHDPENLNDINYELINKRIDPYGMIRGKALCSLLILGDQMDTAYQRVKPKYIQPVEQSGIKAAFRHHVKSVNYNPVAQMLVLSVDSFNDNIKQPSVNNNSLCQLFQFQNVSDAILTDEHREIIKGNNIIKGKKNYDDMDIAILVMQSAHSINKILKTHIQQDLLKLGIPLRSCLIEYNDILFTHFGDISYEPVLHSDYLKSIASSMWSLCSQIFGPQEFSYETLASEVRESNIDKIKMAVRRLSIISGLELLFDNYSELPISPISSNENSWSWCIETVENAKCAVLNIEKLKMVIESLKTTG